MCDLFASIKAQRIAPGGRCTSIGMTGSRCIAGVPAPHASRAIANAGSRSTQQAPVKRAANLVRGNRLLFTIAVLALVGRLDVDNRPVRKLGPVARRRTVVDPVVGGFVYVVAALVAKRGHPFFIAKLLEDPALALRMHEYGEVPFAAKYPLAKCAPSGGACAGVIAVATEKPGAVSGAPARDHVASQQDRLIVGQKVHWVLLPTNSPK